MRKTLTVLEGVSPLSQSRQSRMACGYLYRESTIRGVVEPSNEYAERGSEIHKVISDYINHLVLTKQPTDLARLDSLAQGVGMEALEILEDVRDRLVIDPAKVWGTEIYIALDEDFFPVEVDGSSFASGAATGKPKTYEMTLDYVTLLDAESAEIVDWKSFYRIIEPDTFQGMLYPVGLFCVNPKLKRVTFRLEFVRYGVGRSITYTHDDLPGMVKKIRGERERQLSYHDPSREFEATPGQHCLYCPMLVDRTCPLAGRNPYEMNPAERVQYALYLKAATLENDSRLKDFVTVNGPVQAADANGVSYCAEFKSSSRTSYPMKPAVAVLFCYEKDKPSDMAFMDKLTISGLSTPLKAKKRLDLAEQLRGIANVQPVSKFRIGKAGDDNRDAET